MENIFEGVKKVHLIGIGGIGMSGIAEYLARNGYVVSGSDMILGHVTRRLEKFNIKISEGHNGINLPDDTELVIYTSAVHEDNPEFQKAVSLIKKLVKRAEALGNIVNDKFVISVSGTHGKTTTTAMIAKILIENKLDPTVFVGGNLDFLDGGSSRIGQSNIAVVEADEYDRSFLQLRSDIIVITNIESDHLDIYKDLEDIKENFKKFIRNGKQGLKIIACGDDENVLETVKNFGNKIMYGFKNNNDQIIGNIQHGKKSIMYEIDGEHLKIRVLGMHNILNSSAAYLVSEQINADKEKSRLSLETFEGVKRRLELKFTNGIKIYDDYAHHPTEVEATLEAISKTKHGRIITVFQPHLYTRTRDLYKEFGKSFLGTDVLYLTGIYPAREKEIEGISSELILNEYNSNKKNQKRAGEFIPGRYLEDTSEILDELMAIAKEGDIVIFQGAGDITDLCKKYVNRIKVSQNWTVPL